MKYKNIIVFLIVASISSFISYSFVNNNVFMHLGDMISTGDSTDDLALENGAYDKANDIIDEALIIKMVHYSICGHEEEIGRETVYLNGNEVHKYLEAKYPQYVVVKEDGVRFTVVNTREEICPYSERHLHIGIKDNQVAVYLGPPENGALVEVTNISIKNLPKSELEKLRGGIEVAGEHEMLEVLEGLASLTPFFGSMGR